MTDVSIGNPVDTIHPFLCAGCFGKEMPAFINAALILLTKYSLQNNGI